MRPFNKDIDLTVATNVFLADGIGRQGLGLLGILHDTLRINAYQFQPTNYAGISGDLLKILMKPFRSYDWGRVCFWTYILGLNEQMIEVHKSISSPIKIAYSMFESSQVPHLWRDILNTYYNLLIVPDPYIAQVYKSSGIRIPIFTIPLGIIVENLLGRPFKTKAGDPFVFGISAGFWARKNHLKVLQAFGKHFGNDPKFLLRMHGRFGPQKAEIEVAIKNANYSNVELLTGPLSSKDYDDFMESIDCVVYPSMGEGFSIVPRECLALGKPCILSNNSAHKTICETGFVLPLKANIKVPARYEVFNNQQIGYYDDCNVNDLAALMKEVVENYDRYLLQAQGGREWVKQYLWSNLKGTYTNLIKPKEITLGPSNVINETLWQTSDRALFQKMQENFR